jgi:hypothetical protein
LIECAVVSGGCGGLWAMSAPVRTKAKPISNSANLFNESSSSL